MRVHAIRWLALLDEHQRAAASYAFGHPERYRRHYTPGPRGGLLLDANVDRD